MLRHFCKVLGSTSCSFDGACMSQFTHSSLLPFFSLSEMVLAQEWRRQLWSRRLTSAIPPEPLRWFLIYYKIMGSNLTFFDDFWPILGLPWSSRLLAQPPWKDLEAVIKSAASVASPTAWGAPGRRLGVRTAGTGRSPSHWGDCAKAAVLITVSKAFRGGCASSRPF